MGKASADTVAVAAVLVLVGGAAFVNVEMELKCSSCWSSF